jgi:hypothetical protein
MLSLLAIYANPGFAKKREEVFPVTVKNESIETMIGRGKYHHADSLIEFFPTQQQNEAAIQVKLVQFNRVATSDEVLHELDRNGMRPITLPELLAFGATYPDMQRSFPIVALGTVWSVPGCGQTTCFDDLITRHITYLDGSKSERTLRRTRFESGWGAECRFAAVPK